MPRIPTPNELEDRECEIEARAAEIPPDECQRVEVASAAADRPTRASVRRRFGMTEPDP